MWISLHLRAAVVAGANKAVRNAVPRPLSDAAFMALLCVPIKPRPVSAIIQELERLSKRRYRMTPTTLDELLRPLIEDEWIARIAPESYRLTEIGRIYLQGEIDRLLLITKMSRKRAQLTGGW